MALYLDEFYLNMCSSRLKLFKRKGPHLWNFRCPYCGDSSKSRIRARGYVFRDGGHLVFKCHNCGKTTNIIGLLEKVDPSLIQQYRFAQFREGKTNRITQAIKENDHSVDPNVFLAASASREEIGLPSILDLDQDHPARIYIEKRMLPRERVSDLYYAEFFGEWVDRFSKGNVSVEDYSDRIVIPFRKRSGEVFACQGRTLSPFGVKYLTIKFEENQRKIFGMERWNPKGKTYVVEGPFDSMFLPNAIAASGLDFPQTDPEITIVVFDNERRNREVVRHMEELLKRNYFVCIWPNWFKFKDINDAIISGMPPKQILDTINKNSLKGPAGLLKLKSWSRR